MSALSNPLKWLFQGLIKIYQYTLSPLLGHHCRFFPTCSQYTLEALETYGIVAGSYLGLKRICRCHPLCQGGVDPLPDPKMKEKK